MIFSTMENNIWLSQNYRRSQFPEEFKDWTIEDKIDLFIDRVRYWQLEIADQIINGYKIEEEKIPAIAHSEYATLSVLTSYFEMYGKYHEGHTDDTTGARKHFILGFNLITEQLGWTREVSIENKEEMKIKRSFEKSINKEVNLIFRPIDNNVGIGFYEEIRCGLYHTGMTSRRVIIWEQPSPITMMETVIEDIDILLLYINPQLLPKALLQHLNIYEKRLRNPKNIELRKNFENRFNHDS